MRNQQIDTLNQPLGQRVTCVLCGCTGLKSARGLAVHKKKSRICREARLQRGELVDDQSNLDPAPIQVEDILSEPLTCTGLIFMRQLFITKALLSVLGEFIRWIVRLVYSITALCFFTLYVYLLNVSIFKTPPTAKRINIDLAMAPPNDDNESKVIDLLPFL